jgi:hypothetical protein
MGISKNFRYPSRWARVRDLEDSQIFFGEVIENKGFEDALM